MVLFNSFLYVYQAGYQKINFWKRRPGEITSELPYVQLFQIRKVADTIGGSYAKTTFDHMEVSINGGTPKWMVLFGKIPNKMTNRGSPISETPI